MSSESKKDLQSALPAIEKIEQFMAAVSEKNFYANEEKISAVCIPLTKSALEWHLKNEN